MRQAKRDRKPMKPAAHGKLVENLLLKPLIAELNDRSAASPETERVRNVLRLVMEREQLRRTLPPEPSSLDGLRRFYDSLPPEWFELNRRINRALARYPAVPSINDFPESSLGLEWELVGRASEDKRDALNHLIAMFSELDRGHMERIGQCDCGNYFIARSSLSRFCSGACRVRFWESSETRQRQKRERAKELYWLHKSGKVK